MSIWELFQLVEKQWRSWLASFLVNPFFFTSMRYLGLGLLFFSFRFFTACFLSVFSCSVLIITHFFRMLQRGGHSRVRLEEARKTKCEREGTEDTNQLVGLRGSGSTMDKIGLRRVFGERGRGCCLNRPAGAEARLRDTDDGEVNVDFWF